MKQILLISTLLTLSILGFAQVKYKAGYFINNEGVKTSCLIKDMDWRNNPTSFTYKLNESSPEQTAAITNVSSFEILQTSKYVRVTTEIDTSSSDLNNLSRIKDPQYKRMQVFLKYLVEGKASLFVYEQENLRKFLYSINGANPIELLYKKYYLTDGDVGINKGYLQQLANDVTCKNNDASQVENMNYINYELVKHFIRYNKCEKTEYVNVGGQRKRDRFNLTARAGTRSQQFSVTNTSTPQESFDFESKMGVRLGLEAEYVLPFKNSKWTFIVEGTYQSYEDEKPYKSTFQNDTARISYKSFEIPLGVRHYFFLTDQSKLFLNLTMSFDVVSKKSFYKPITTLPITINTTPNLSLGAGYNYGNKFSVEFRYGFDRQIFYRQKSVWDGAFGSYALMVGYSIF
jgi:hypothetical protein